MKRLGLLALLLLVALPGWSAAAKKITVAQLKDTLASLQSQNKSDAEVATALKQIVLTEELTRPVMNELAAEVPGPLSTEQIYVLEARSAMLAPPASDLPSTPAPDPATQQALLTKAANYASTTWQQLPALTVTKTTLRFQDNIDALAPGSGMHSAATDVSVGSAFVSPYQFVHYINSSDMNIAFQHGAETLPADKTNWGANKMIALQEPDPSLATVFQEAQAAGGVHWIRWETVNGKTAAVFAFEVPKKKTHMAVNVCCFPSIDQTGSVRFTSASGFGAGQPGGAAGGPGGAKGNLQTTTDYKPYRGKDIPYHGEFFIDPDTGIVVRMITQDEIKQTDVVHQVDTRIDYGPVQVGDKTLVLPTKTVVNTEVVPYGESGGGTFATRVTLFTSEYKNYALSGGSAQK